MATATTAKTEKTVTPEAAMAQGDFTKEEAKATEEAFKEVFDALPKRKQMEFIGHANDIYLFLAACQRECPSEK
jgi:hypothetical protein